ncbi:MAG: helix-turn-helix transcriptional regulator [Proteobacteria bacterium]|nr:helix-turn-helix transcriptional regulator [Pseudomonadota bacterium]MCL2306712.1 helix-turn-helix transcriptional regulator [Pseudomonadota bacterium]
MRQQIIRQLGSLANPIPIALSPNPSPASGRGEHQGEMAPAANTPFEKGAGRGELDSGDVERAIEILRREVESSSYRKVAARLGYSITTISMILNGKYQATLEKVAAEIMQMIARYPCPHTGEELSPEKCKATCAGKAPTHNPMAMRHWRACQVCPHGQRFLNGKNGGNENVAGS